MKLHAKALLLSTCLAFTLTSNASFAATTLTVDVHFHIEKGMVWYKDDVKMTSWIRKSLVRNAIMDEINDIWAPADIEFEASTINFRTTEDYDGIEDDVDVILDLEEGEDTPYDEIQNLIDTDKEKSGINIWILPYLGHTNQGSASEKNMRVFIGRYTARPSDGETPVRALLIEDRPFDLGSMSRTIAHELGHVLSLSHHEEELDGSGHLMGGEAKSGYNLTDDEIEAAREAAASF